MSIFFIIFSLYVGFRPVIALKNGKEMSTIMVLRGNFMATKTEAKGSTVKKSAPTTKDKIKKISSKLDAKKSENAPAEKKEVRDVHTLSYVPDKGWAVKRQGSTKVIKYFPTKLEAVEYLVKVSGKQNTRVVIRLKNGKFQKFDNAVRALNYSKTSKDDDEKALDEAPDVSEEITE